MKKTIFVLLGLMNVIEAFGQGGALVFGANPCGGNLAYLAQTSQSSALDTHSGNLAVDGLLDQNAPEFSTQFENNPWWEVDMGQLYTLKGIRVSKRENYAMGAYYIFFSTSPFASNRPEVLAQDTSIVSMHIADEFPNGYFFDNQGVIARYIRIQKIGPGILQLLEIEPCIEELCGNGIDDDQDGATDCVDDECLPFPYFSVHHTYCNGQKINIKANASARFKKYYWQICKINNGAVLSCKETPLAQGTTIPDFDVNQFLGTSLECGYTYKIKLLLYNDCPNPAVLEETFKVVCSEASLDYKDILVCSQNYAFDATLTSLNINCQNCQYQWMPGVYLNNANVAFPTIMGSVFPNALKSDYTVRAVTTEGCIYYETVKIVEQHSVEIFYQNSETEFCQYMVKAQIKTGAPMESSFFRVEFWEVGAQQTQPILGILDVASPDNQSFIFRLPGALERLNPKNYIVKIFIENSGGYQFFGNCIIEKQVSAPSPNLFVGDFIFFMAGIFTPNNDGINDTYGPFIPEGFNPEQISHNATKGRFRVWNRLGNLVFNSGWLDSTPTTPFNLGLMRWNGSNMNGGSPVSDVYVWILEMENCDSGGVREWHGEVNLEM